MDAGKWIKQVREMGGNALSETSGVLGTGVGFIRESVGKAWLFGSTEQSSSYDHQEVDEKHYFLMPDRRAEAGYSLYVMRCLPDGVPPVNDLPKRRLFHLPNARALPTLESILLEDARDGARSTPAEPGTVGNRLNELADEIDRLDGKVFSGVLLVGGLVALVNPVAGAAVAAKALLPSVGMLLSKYGLKYAGDAANQRELTGRIRSAEKQVLKQFRDAGTSSLVNPLLAQLDQALDTDEFEYDPLLSFDPASMNFGDHDRSRLFRLSCQAVANTYEGVIERRKEHAAACLGPEDLRFLKLIRDIASEP